MKTTNFKINSKYDGLTLGALVAEPDSMKPTGILQFVHGMCEMKERYLPFMEYLTSRGFICIIHDHRGHGESIRSKKDLGFVYGGGAASLVEDTHLLTDYAKKKYPGLPLSMLGHSMGALITRCYLKKYDCELASCVICGAPSRNPVLGVAKLMAGTAKHFHGSHYVSKSLVKASFSGWNKKWPEETSEFAWLSTNKDNVKAYEESEFCGFPFTVDGYEALFGLMEKTYSPKDWKMENPDLPIRFIGGADDPCIGGEVNFNQMMDFLRDRGYRNVNGKLYPGLRHEVLNEIGKEEIWKETADWLAENK